MKRTLFIACGLALWTSTCAAQAPTPDGYWEGTAHNHEVKMKDSVRTLTRTVDADFWFTVRWDARRNMGTVTGAAEAKYDSELKMDNLPKVTVPAPGGGTVKFEPSVGGKLGGDNRRRFPLIGVLRVDPATGNGTLFLQKVNAPAGTASQQRDREAGGSANFDSPMEFVLRGDPGVSGAMGGLGGSSVSVSNSGTVSADSGMGPAASANVGKGVGVTVVKIPMAPFSPFTSQPGKVSKRAGGPYTALFEENSEKYATRWTAKQAAGSREGVALTPDMQRQLEELQRRVERLERGRR
jgi:hypothetical protein